MAIVYENLLNFPIPEIRQRLRWQDTALYALSRLGVAGYLNEYSAVWRSAFPAPVNATASR